MKKDLPPAQSRFLISKFSYLLLTLSFLLFLFVPLSCVKNPVYDRVIEEELVFDGTINLATLAKLHQNKDYQILSRVWSEDYRKSYMDSLLHSQPNTIENRVVSARDYIIYRYSLTGKLFGKNKIDVISYLNYEENLLTEQKYSKSKTRCEFHNYNLLIDCYETGNGIYIVDGVGAVLGYSGAFANKCREFIEAGYDGLSYALGNCKQSSCRMEVGNAYIDIIRYALMWLEEEMARKLFAQSSGFLRVPDDSELFLLCPSEGLPTNAFHWDNLINAAKSASDQLSEIHSMLHSGEGGSESGGGGGTTNPPTDPDPDPDSMCEKCHICKECISSHHCNFPKCICVTVANLSANNSEVVLSESCIISLSVKSKLLVSSVKLQMKRERGEYQEWPTLTTISGGDNKKVFTYTHNARLAGKFDVRAIVYFSDGTTLTSNIISIEEIFPDAQTILDAPGVRSYFNELWGDAKSYAQNNGKKNLVIEYGCFVILDVKTGVYRCTTDGVTSTPIKLTPEVVPGIDFVSPIKEERLEQGEAGEFVVALFHTHYPICFAWGAGERDVGPSGHDLEEESPYPCFVYDYLSDSPDEKLSCLHEVYYDSKIYHFGKNRRETLL